MILVVLGTLATATVTATQQTFGSSSFNHSLKKHHENYGFARSWRSGFVRRTNH
jgi:hypothetical protein